MPDQPGFDDVAVGFAVGIVAIEHFLGGGLINLKIAVFFVAGEADIGVFGQLLGLG